MARKNLADDREFTKEEIKRWLKRARPIESVKKFRKGAVVVISTPMQADAPWDVLRECLPFAEEK